MDYREWVERVLQAAVELDDSSLPQRVAVVFDWAYLREDGSAAWNEGVDGRAHNAIDLVLFEELVPLGLLGWTAQYPPRQLVATPRGAEAAQRGIESVLGGQFNQLFHGLSDFERSFLASLVGRDRGAEQDSDLYVVPSEQIASDIYTELGRRYNPDLAHQMTARLHALGCLIRHPDPTKRATYAGGFIHVSPRYRGYAVADRVAD